MVRIEQLNACHVGRHQVDGSVKDAVIEGAKVALLDQQGADVIGLQLVVRPVDVFANRRTRLLKHDTHGTDWPYLIYTGPKRQAVGCLTQWGAF